MSTQEKDRSERALVKRTTRQELAKWKRDNALQYRELISYCRCAMKETEARVHIAAEELTLQNGVSPVESVTSELRSAESIADSILESGCDLTVNTIENSLSDIARVCVICTFPSDLYRIAEALLCQKDLSLLERGDYVASPMENGYRGLHLVVGVPVTLRGRGHLAKVQVELRTPAMELWKSAQERFLRDTDVFLPEQIEQEMRACAQLSAEWDQRMEQIHYNVEHRVITK